jgi:phosphoglycolate phosphatase
VAWIGEVIVSDILLDLDGTLTDPAVGITRSLNYALARLGLPELPVAQLTRYVGPSLDVVFAELLPAAGRDEVRQAVRYYRERYNDIGWRENQPYAGIHEILASLRGQGHRLHVCTSKPRSIARTIVGHFDLAPAFASINGCGLNRTKASLIAGLLGDGAVDERAWMIGDRASDIAAGKTNGLRTAGVAWGYGSRPELAAAHPDHVLAAPSELLRLPYD